mmetsp:Transcript_3908/g.11127  ORF Transcript_3908/g.11127 Transcript_3908/m.11127 type:complete len:319 (-) Transcript_3908:480-1436(-)
MSSPAGTSWSHAWRTSASSFARCGDQGWCSKNAMEVPGLPFRPVRPTRCTYVSMSSGKSKITTWLTLDMSTPRPTTSVATRAWILPSRNACSVASRCSCFRAPCITPQRSRPKYRATSSPRSSAALRVFTNIRAFPAGAPISPPSASSRCRKSSGSFFCIGPWPPFHSLQEVLMMSTCCRISRGGRVRPWRLVTRSPSSSELYPSAPPPAGATETFWAEAPDLQSRLAACSTSGGQVAEKKSIWRSLRISAEIAATSSSKPKSSIRSPSSSTKNETRRRLKAPQFRTKSSRRPGVATIRWHFRWARSACSWSIRRAPP